MKTSIWTLLVVIVLLTGCAGPAARHDRRVDRRYDRRERISYRAENPGYDTRRYVRADRRADRWDRWYGY